MKKSTGVILVLIIVLLLGVIGVGGYFFIKGNPQIAKLQMMFKQIILTRLQQVIKQIT